MREDPPRSWSLAAAGDLCAIGRVEKALCESGSEAMLGARLRGVLAGATVRLVNLESPVCEKAAPIAKTGPNFQSSPRALSALKAAGLEVVVPDNGPR